MADFSDLDREAARSSTGGWLWKVGGRWTAGGDSCPLARNGYGDLVPMSSVANGRVQAALQAGEWVVAARNGMEPDRPPCAVRKAGSPQFTKPFIDWDEVERLRQERAA